MKNASIVFSEALVMGNHPLQDYIIQGQASYSSQQPAVSCRC